MSFLSLLQLVIIIIIISIIIIIIIIDCCCQPLLSAPNHFSRVVVVVVAGERVVWQPLARIKILLKAFLKMGIGHSLDKIASTETMHSFYACYPICVIEKCLLFFFFCTPIILFFTNFKEKWRYLFG